MDVTNPDSDSSSGRRPEVFQFARYAAQGEGVTDGFFPLYMTRRLYLWWYSLPFPTDNGYASAGAFFADDSHDSPKLRSQKLRVRTGILRGYDVSMK
jgi:hypothetical protein